MILSSCRHGVALPSQRSVSGLPLAQYAKFSLSARQHEAPDPNSKPTRTAASSRDDATKTSQRLEEGSPVVISQAMRRKQRRRLLIPSLEQLQHQVELAGPADVLRRRFFGPFALLRGRAINERMARTDFVKDVMKQTPAQEKQKEQEEDDIDPVVARENAEQSAVKCAVDLFNAQGLGAYEPGDLQRIITVASQNSEMARNLATPSLQGTVIKTAGRREQQDRLRFYNVYITLFERQGLKLHPLILWQALLSSAFLLNLTALKRYLLLWRNFRLRSPPHTDESKKLVPFSSLLNQIILGLKSSPASDRAGLKAALLGFPDTAEHGEYHIRAQIQRPNGKIPLLFEWIQILESANAGPELFAEYQHWVRLKGEQEHNPASGAMTPAQNRMTVRFILALFATQSAPLAWRVFRASGFAAGEGLDYYDAVLARNAASRPDFASEEELTHEESQTLARRLAAQQVLVERRLCDKMAGELAPIEVALRVRWVASEEEGLAPGYHVSLEEGDGEEDEEEDAEEDREERRG